jgi:hypothetical protein
MGTAAGFHLVGFPIFEPYARMGLWRTHEELVAGPFIPRIEACQSTTVSQRPVSANPGLWDIVPPPKKSPVKIGDGSLTSKLLALFPLEDFS